MAFSIAFGDHFCLIGGFFPIPLPIIPRPHFFGNVLIPAVSSMVFVDAPSMPFRGHSSKLFGSLNNRDAPGRRSSLTLRLRAMASLRFQKDFLRKPLFRGSSLFSGRNRRPSLIGKRIPPKAARNLV